MGLKSAALIYFSPTGSTKKILSAIAKGLDVDKVNLIDMTLPAVRNTVMNHIEEDIVLIGVPVYKLRVPDVLTSFLNNLKGNNKPAILSVVYGNLEEGKALEELYKIAENAGFNVIAAGSFIGENSFSTDKLPVGGGRPNEEDIREAEKFGKSIKEELFKANEIKHKPLKIPKRKLAFVASLLPENFAKVWTKAPVADRSKCNGCNVCASLCPMAAINGDTMEIDDSKCLRCFCCVRRCGQKARKIVFKKKLIVSNLLYFKNKTKNEPRLYF